MHINSFHPAPARNHAGGPATKTAKKGGQKADCLSIAKKLALLKEFEEVKNSGVRNPNKEICDKNTKNKDLQRIYILYRISNGFRKWYYSIYYVYIYIYVCVLNLCIYRYPQCILKISCRGGTFETLP